MATAGSSGLARWRSPHSVARLRQSASLRAEAMASEGAGSVDWVVLQPAIAVASAATSAADVDRRQNLPCFERTRGVMTVQIAAKPAAGSRPHRPLSNKALTLMSG